MKHLKVTLFLLATFMLSSTVCNAQKTKKENKTEIYEDDYEDDFKFIYPIKVKKKDGSTTTIKNEKELDALYDALPEDKEPNFVFPLKVKLKDGTLKTIKNAKELEALYGDFEGEKD